MKRLLSLFCKALGISQALDPFLKNFKNPAILST
jgi:hypothetical protein